MLAFHSPTVISARTSWRYDNPKCVSRPSMVVSTHTRTHGRPRTRRNRNKHQRVARRKQQTREAAPSETVTRTTHTRKQQDAPTPDADHGERATLGDEVFLCSCLGIGCVLCDGTSFARYTADMFSALVPPDISCSGCGGPHCMCSGFLPTNTHVTQQMNFVNGELSKELNSYFDDINKCHF